MKICIIKHFDTLAFRKHWDLNKFKLSYTLAHKTLFPFSNEPIYRFPLDCGTGFDFTPSEIAAEIKKHIPNFTITYKPDFRQKIADSWPASIDDSSAQKDWNWKHKFDMASMTVEMLENLKK